MTNTDSSINITYKLDKIRESIIEEIIKRISLNKNNIIVSNFRRKYSLKQIITYIMYYLYEARNWRSLGSNYSGFYKYFCKLKPYFELTYIDLLKKYIKNTNGRTLKIISVDTTFINNKYGTNCIGRNKFNKNKNSTKLFSAVDINGIPIINSLHEGNIHDSKIFSSDIQKSILNYKAKIKYLLADSGFCCKIRRKTFNENNIKCIIPYNIRNNKIINDEEKENFTFKECTKKDRIIYKERIIVENYFANLKQINKLNIRQTKEIKSFMALINIYSIGKIIKKMQI